jgi:hypothetical protein
MPTLLQREVKVCTTHCMATQNNGSQVANLDELHESSLPVFSFIYVRGQSSDSGFYVEK